MESLLHLFLGRRAQWETWEKRSVVENQEQKNEIIIIIIIIIIDLFFKGPIRNLVIKKIGNEGIFLGSSCLQAALSFFLFLLSGTATYIYLSYLFYIASEL